MKFQSVVLFMRITVASKSLFDSKSIMPINEKHSANSNIMVNSLGLHN